MFDFLKIVCLSIVFTGCTTDAELHQCTTIAENVVSSSDSTMGFSAEDIIDQINNTSWDVEWSNTINNALLNSTTIVPNAAINPSKDIKIIELENCFSNKINTTNLMLPIVLTVSNSDDFEISGNSFFYAQGLNDSTNYLSSEMNNVSLPDELVDAAETEFDSPVYSIFIEGGLDELLVTIGAKSDSTYQLLAEAKLTIIK